MDGLDYMELMQDNEEGYGSRAIIVKSDYNLLKNNLNVFALNNLLFNFALDCLNWVEYIEYDQKFLTHLNY